MKILKHFKVIVALLLALGAIGTLIHYCSRMPSNEITRAQLLQFLAEHRLSRASVTPLVYPGIYNISGAYLVPPAKEPKPFTITTHLDEKQFTGFLSQANVDVELPGQGGKTQIVNIVSTVVIAGLIALLVIHQMRIGKAKSSSRVKSRPAIRFRDVAGIEEDKTVVR
jgi:ATP-dependent Zn protease